MSDDALEQLAARAAAELALLAYPTRPWVLPRTAPDGTAAVDVLVVGGAQSGTGIAFALRRAGVTDVCVVDAAPAGREGPWRTVARMNELRTPKHLVGVETGIPSLTVSAWFQARHGAEAWAAIDRIGREDWAEYLGWLRARAGIAVEHEVRVTSVEPVAGDDALVAVDTAGPDGARRRYARHVVLATGFTGSGAWHTPDHIAAAVPAHLRHHACEGYDPAAYRGRRVGVLGHGASAFDAAAALLEHGAAHVDLCFRRPAMPTINPHRAVEFHGFLGSYADLDDAVRWEVARFFDGADQPPAPDGYRRAHRHANLAVHAGAPWDDVQVAGPDGPVLVRTPIGSFSWDRIICATGARPDLEARPELAALAPHIARWGDVYTPPPGHEHDGLAAFPYLGRGFELQPRPGAPACVTRVYGFNAGGYVSRGPSATSISALKFDVPRIVQAIVTSLMRDQQHELVPTLAAFREPEPLVLPDTAPLEAPAA